MSDDVFEDEAITLTPSRIPATSQYGKGTNPSPTGYPGYEPPVELVRHLAERTSGELSAEPKKYSLTEEEHKVHKVIISQRKIF